MGLFFFFVFLVISYIWILADTECLDHTAIPQRQRGVVFWCALPAHFSTPPKPLRSVRTTFFQSSLQNISGRLPLTLVPDHIPSLHGSSSCCHVWIPKAYSFVELFCGDAWVSRVMRSEGCQTASLDIRLGGATWAQRKKQNPYDLCEDSGFLLLWRHILFNLVSVIVRCWTFYIVPHIDPLPLLRWGLVGSTYVLKSQFNLVGSYHCLPKNAHPWNLDASHVLSWG